MNRGPMQKQKCVISYTEKIVKFVTKFHQSMNTFRKNLKIIFFLL